MADDNNQGFFRAAQPRAPMKSSTNDPLAELARLIGQTDPFAEFGHKSQHNAPAAPSAAPHQEWGPQGQAYVPQSYEQQSPADPYHTQHEQDRPAAGYGNDPYYSDDASPETEMAYDDVPPPRRRLGVIAIAAVSALAVVGTAGAFGYRSLFGSSGSSPPPIIKPDPAPTKVVPPSKVEAQSNKLIYDRVGERSSGEKIVSREEQPIDISKPTQANLFPSAIGAGQSATPASSVGAAAMDQPKKIHTIVIKPDQPLGATEPPPASSRAAAAKPAPVPAAKPLAPVKPAAPQRLASAPPVTTADAEETAPVARAAPAPARAAAPPRSANAPLSLSPDAPAPARAEPARTASAPPVRSAPPVASGGAGQYAVQVSSQRSEAEAEAAFRTLQGKYPDQLGGKPHVIRRADLGEKGTYYRALVGPFTSAADANGLCQSLKSAGGSCLIQKN